MSKVGRPKKYETVGELTDALNEYFENTDESKYTVTGVALTIGSKQLLQDYENREDYKEIVRRAKLLVEHSYELRLIDKAYTGAIFALKNMGWSDHQSIQIDNSDIPFSIAIESRKNSNTE